MKKNIFKVKENTIALAQALYKLKAQITKKDKQIGEEIQTLITEIYCAMEMINHPHLTKRQYDQVYELLGKIFRLKYNVLMLSPSLGDNLNEITKHIDGLTKSCALIIDIAKDGEKIKIS